jgi:hypothetical protein
MQELAQSLILQSAAAGEHYSCSHLRCVSLSLWQRGQRQPAGPGNFDWDMGVHMDYTLHEALKLHFRAEFFNAFNHPNFSDPNATLTGAGFGAVTAAGNPRIGQLALKLNF